MDEFTQDPTVAHTHKCGQLSDGRFLSIGCGHKWTHKQESIYQNILDRVKTHKCPQCGMGPWYSVIGEDHAEHTELSARVDTHGEKACELGTNGSDYKPSA